MPPAGFWTVDESQFQFNLRGDTGDDAYLIAVDAAGRPVRFADYVAFGPSASNGSIGRYPDGQGDMLPLEAPTFGLANRPATGGISRVTSMPMARQRRRSRPDLRRPAGPCEWIAVDLNGDRQVDLDDLDLMVKDILKTTIGDANLDGRFNSSDLVQILQAGGYEDDIDGNATWVTGDWNCDGDFDSSDLVPAWPPEVFEREDAEAQSASGFWEIKAVLINISITRPLQFRPHFLRLRVLTLKTTRTPSTGHEDAGDEEGPDLERGIAESPLGFDFDLHLGRLVQQVAQQTRQLLGQHGASAGVLGHPCQHRQLLGVARGIGQLQVKGLHGEASRRLSDRLTAQLRLHRHDVLTRLFQRIQFGRPIVAVSDQTNGLRHSRITLKRRGQFRVGEHIAVFRSGAGRQGHGFAGTKTSSRQTHPNIASQQLVLVRQPQHRLTPEAPMGILIAVAPPAMSRIGGEHQHASGVVLPRQQAADRPLRFPPSESPVRRA